MATKCYWMGEDIETLPRERLLEIIPHLMRQLECTRETTRQIMALNRLARERMREVG